MTISELLPRLQELLDKQAITELVYSYCNAADRRDYPKLHALYHDDATDDHGGFFKGLAKDFIDQLPEIQESMLILHHNVTTINIKLDGDRGEGEIYVLAYHKVQSDPEPFDLLIGGRYLDQYEKRDGVWKFAHRSVLADWVNVHNPSIVDLDSPSVRGSLIGQPDDSDPSYALFQLLKRGVR